LKQAIQNNCTALLLAAGNGARLQQDRPKALVLLARKPLFLWSLGVLQAWCKKIVLVVPKDFVNLFDGICQQLEQPIVIATGGKERWQSSLCGLEHVQTEFVLVHDSARPFITVELCCRIFAAAERSGGAIPAVNVVDTIKRVDAGGNVIQTLDRSQLKSIQTPQIFQTNLLKRALDHQDKHPQPNITDDASVIESIYPNLSIQCVDGEENNRKITTPDDLNWAEWHVHQHPGTAS